MFLKMNKRIVGVLFVVLLVVISIVVTALQSKNPTDSSADTFVSAIQKKDAAKTYALFSDAQKSTLTQTAWSHDLQTITSQSGSNKFKKQGETTFSKTDSTVAYVNYTLKNGSNTYKLNLIMSKHSGWLVDSVQFEPIRPGTTVQVTPVEKEGE